MGSNETIPFIITLFTVHTWGQIVTIRQESGNKSIHVSYPYLSKHRNQPGLCCTGEQIGPETSLFKFLTLTPFGLAYQTLNVTSKGYWGMCVISYMDQSNYSQLSRKRRPVVQDKVVAYGRWSKSRLGASLGRWLLRESWLYFVTRVPGARATRTLFLLWCTFLVPSLKNTAPIFLEIFLIECCTVLVEPPMTSSLSHLHNTKT